MNQEALSVTLLTRIIQETLEQGFPFVRVVGEISNYKHHSSGHKYFTLKDEGAQIRAVMWKTRQLDFKPFDGMKVIVSGRITLYASQGNYQIDCFSLVPAGIGDLYVAFEKLKAELQALGYFDASRKKALPAFPLKVGVATSPTGAAIRDILSTMEQRMPACEIVFRPTLVQGEGSARDIVAAIATLDQQRCDVIIIGRGGGSIEDLWSFNTREVADAVLRAETPIISAVGHETDVCIADFVADYRAATPTAAAVLCAPVRADELRFELDHTSDRMTDSITDVLELKLSMVKSWVDQSVLGLISRHIAEHRQHMDRFVQSCTASMQYKVSLLETTIEGASRSLRAVQPLSPLQRGFALIRQNGKVVATNAVLSVSDEIEVVRAHQELEVVVRGVKTRDARRVEGT